MLHPLFVRPQYGQACFSDIPHTIERLLTGKGRAGLRPDLLGPLHRPFKNVVCLFIDALGWRFIASRLTQHPFLETIVRRGVATKLTSQFPSTTAVHMTAFHTGLTPARSGIFEWRYHEPALGEMICPLPFSLSGDRTRGTLAALGIDPASLYPPATFYQRLACAGVQSTAFIPEGYWDSPFSKHMTQGATRRPVKTLAEGLTNAVLQLQATALPQYINLYHPDIDTLCHRYGPNAPQVAAQIDVVLSTLERCLLDPNLPKDDTLLLITADHGQVEVSPERTFYLNLDPRLLALPEMLQTTPDGRPLVPGGSPRDLFLYVKPARLDDAAALLTPVLKGIADVIKVQDLVEEGFFGDTQVCDAFRARIANLVILPYKHEAVWWYEEGRFANTFYGHHGGLTADEMEIPLLACPL